MVAGVAGIDPVGHETATYWLELRDPGERGGYAFEAGQINMIYLWGLGEVPISVSSDPAEPSLLAHTVRVAGSVTAGFPRLRVGDDVGLRGPFGRPWPLDAALGADRDVVVVAGGLGLAPLRSAICVALRRRTDLRRLVLLVGARTPDDVPFRKDLEAWRRGGDAEVALTVDDPSGGWPHRVGLVTELIEPARLDAGRTTALVCGPQVMMTATADALTAAGVSPSDVYVSLERNMQCAVRRCGHCQLGPAFVCADGPVFSYREMEPWLRVAQL